jgi:hypothetical protein
MAVMGRLQPFVAVTQSIAFAMPAKGNLRPTTAIQARRRERPFPDRRADIVSEEIVVRRTNPRDCPLSPT